MPHIGCYGPRGTHRVLSGPRGEGRRARPTWILGCARWAGRPLDPPPPAAAGRRAVGAGRGRRGPDRRRPAERRLRPLPVPRRRRAVHRDRAARLVAPPGQSAGFTHDGVRHGDHRLELRGLGSPGLRRGGCDHRHPAAVRADPPGPRRPDRRGPGPGGPGHGGRGLRHRPALPGPDLGVHPRGAALRHAARVPPAAPGRSGRRRAEVTRRGGRPRDGVAARAAPARIQLGRSPATRRPARLRRARGARRRGGR